MGYLCLLYNCYTCSSSSSGSLVPYPPPPPHPPPLLTHPPLHLLLLFAPPCLELHTQPFFFRRHGLFFLSPSLYSVPLLWLSFPPSFEIAVVSYGFLFLRDGRWVHVGVEATKHAASCIHARLPADSTTLVWLCSRPLAHAQTVNDGEIQKRVN